MVQHRRGQHGLSTTPITSAPRRSTGYERLLYDCMIGDATLFQRADMVEAAWRVVAPILDVWEALPPRDFPNYAAGTWGPKEADDLLDQISATGATANDSGRGYRRDQHPARFL